MNKSNLKKGAKIARKSVLARGHLLALFVTLIVAGVLPPKAEAAPKAKLKCSCEQLKKAIEDDKFLMEKYAEKAKNIQKRVDAAKAMNRPYTGIIAAQHANEYAEWQATTLIEEFKKARGYKLTNTFHPDPSNPRGMSEKELKKLKEEAPCQEMVDEVTAHEKYHNDVSKQIENKERRLESAADMAREEAEAYQESINVLCKAIVERCCNNEKMKGFINGSCPQKCPPESSFQRYPTEEERQQQRKQIQNSAEHVSDYADAAKKSVIKEQDSYRDKVVKEYINLCRDQAKKDTACEKLRNEAIPFLKEDILTVGSSADKSYLPALSKILGSDEPVLRAVAADAMGMIGPTQAENPALIKALNDPVPLVRNSSRAALEASNEPMARLLVHRAEKDRGKSIKPDSVLDARRLGAPVYAGATFLYFASNLTKGHAGFVTPDSVATVLKFYGAKAKGPAMTAEQFEKSYNKEPDQAAKMQMAMEMQERMMKAMQEGKSPEEMQAEMLKGMTTELPIREYSDRELYGSPMFLVLEESSLGGMKRPVRFVAVFEDRAFKQTGFVLHIPVTIPTAVPKEMDPDM